MEARPKIFRFRGKDGRVYETMGRVKNADRFTLDGLRVVEVEFSNGTTFVRNYSAQHIEWEEKK